MASNLQVADITVLDGSAVGAPTLPAGTFVVDPAPVTVQVYERNRPMVEVEQAPAESVVVRPDSVVPGAVVVVVGEPVGCCGLDGADGPNQACAFCGQVLGTVWTDCWTPHEVRFMPDAVVVISAASA